jgi:xylulokinase
VSETILKGGRKVDVILGIDLGTSSLKMAFFDRDGKQLEDYSTCYPIHMPNVGWHEQKPDDWVQALKSGIDEIRRYHPSLLENLQAIGITGQMHGFVPVDRNGDHLYPAIIWSDQRNGAELERLTRALPIEGWVELTGNRPNSSFTLGKILWLKNHLPDVYGRTYKFLLPKDYLRMKLVGTFLTDYSDASATLMMNIRKGEWSEWVCRTFQVDRGKLPDIKKSTESAGTVTDEAAALFGLKSGIPVYCGCGDAQAQAIGNSIIREDEWLCTIGTGGQLFVSTDRPYVDKKGTVHTLAHGIPEKWVLMGATLSAGMSLKWLGESVFQSRYGLGELLDRAKGAEPGSKGLIFLPYLAGERTPHMDKSAKGTFVGLTNGHTVAEMVRSVVEGVLFSLYDAYTIVTETIGRRPNRLVLTGGAVRHPLWLSTAADLFGIPVERKKGVGSGSYGAAMLAAVGSGLYPDFPGLFRTWNVSSGAETYEPDWENHRIYMDLFGIYQDLYHPLQDAFQRLDAFQKGTIC